ncbi:MAG: protein kinase [Ktedonobacteraceae bacterium]|nr:protein kinase [Ktedonobacteraceae bacterium]
MGTDRSVNRLKRLSGRYNLLRLTGRGGMGEVWLAEDSELKRQVAIKLLPGVLASDKAYLDAFRYEARAAAALEHPHILSVHDFGEEIQEDGVVTTYLVMPYVAGGTLRDRLRAVGRPLPVDEAMSYLSQAAQAIDYAHSQGVLHRDIKPANMLLNDSWLLLADFGIAKLLTTGSYRSQTHKGAGTPEYMAPEQAQQVAEPASDRYSLGIVAYQLFTAHLPFQGETPYGILIKHIRETPPPPRHFNPAIPQAVEKVLLQGIARHPRERPGSCVAFVAALEQAWKEGVGEDEDPDATLLAPWSKRHYENVPTQRVTPTISEAPSTPGQEGENVAAEWQQTISQDDGEAIVGAMNSIVSKPSPAKTSQIEVKSSRRSIVIGGIAAAAALVGGATIAELLHRSTPFGINKQSVVLPSLPPGPRKLIPGVPLLSLNGHNDMTHSAEWDPTGRYLATGAIDTRLMLWDIKEALSKGKNSFLSILTPQHTWIMRYLTGDHEICWSADGHNIIVAEGIWMIDPFQNPDHMTEYSDLVTEFENDLGPASYDSLAWRPGTDSFAASVDVSSNDSGVIAVELWSRSHPQKSLKILRYSRPLPVTITAHTLAWSSDGTLLAACLAEVTSGLTEAYPPDSRQVLIWQAETGQVKQVISLPPPAHKAVTPWKTPLAWSPVEAHLLVFGHWNNAVIWDVQRNAPLLMLSTTDAQDHKATAVNVLALAWSPDGRYIAGCYDRSRKIYIWDVSTLRRAAPSSQTVRYQTLSFPQTSGAGHSLSVTNVSWSPDGRYIASTSYDKTVLVWRVDGS